MTYDRIVAHFENVRRSGNRAMAKCPAHADSTNSLELSAAEDRTLIRCHAGCATTDILAAKGLKMADLFYASRNGNGAGSNHQSGSGLTLEHFALAKGFEIEFLKQCGVAEDKGGLVFHYLLINGQRAQRQRIRLALSGDRKFIWNKAEGRPVPYGLWRLEEARKQKVADLYLVEGESDSLTLWAHGLTALGIPGADNCRLLQTPHVAGFQRLFIVRENDRGGEVFEKGCTGRLAELEYSGQVAVVEMARAEIKDANDLRVKMLGDPGGFESEWTALVEQARTVELPIVGLQDFSDVEIVPREVEWLWPNRIPVGKLSLFVGQPGVGKSYVTLDLAAHLSDGRMWPDGTPNGRVATSIIFSAEDDPADTIVPRLRAQRAVPGHVQIAGRVRESDEAGEIRVRAFNLQRDFAHLERMMQKHPGPGLVVIDPISAYLGRVDGNKNFELRSEVLDPLSLLAARYGKAIIAVSHFNKVANANGLERVSGSIAFPAAARQAWGFAKDPDDSTRKLMVFGKSNLGPEMAGLAYRIAPDERGTVCLQWLNDQIDENLNELLRREQEASRDSFSERKLDAAIALIREMLSERARPMSDIEKRAREMGISERTLCRAKRELQVRTYRRGFAGACMAELPSLH